MKPTLIVFDWEGTLVTHATNLFEWKPVATLFQGTQQVLTALQVKGYQLAIATNSSRAALNQDLQDTGLNALFLATVTADEAPLKPHPAMLLRVMDQLGCVPSETLMIGDSSSDMEMAERIHVPSIFIQRDGGDARYSKTIFDIQELLTLL